MAAYAADSEAIGKRLRPRERQIMGEKFERHKQAWTTEEVQKLHTLAKKGMPLRAIAKALTRSEESVKTRAKLDKLGIAALR
jgi:DNA-binding NarL/FixJ family response regulator